MFTCALQIQNEIQLNDIYVNCMSKYANYASIVSTLLFLEFC